MIVIEVAHGKGTRKCEENVMPDCEFGRLCWIPPAPWWCICDDIDDSSPFRLRPRIAEFLVVRYYLESIHIRVTGGDGRIWLLAR